MIGVNMSFGPLSLKRVDKPLLVIAGDRDPLIKPAEAMEIAEKSPKGQVIIVEGAGHVESIKVLGPGNYVDKIELFLVEKTGIQIVQAIVP
jgi:predicted alpha/beta hydrolase family esterase